MNIYTYICIYICIYGYMYIYIYIYIYVTGSSGPPPSHRIYSRRAPPMGRCPRGCGVAVHMVGGMHVCMHAMYAYIDACMPFAYMLACIPMHAYVSKLDVDMQMHLFVQMNAYACICMHGMHVSLAGGVFLGGGREPWTPAHIYIHLHIFVCPYIYIYIYSCRTYIREIYIYIYMYALNTYFLICQLPCCTHIGYCIRILRVPAGKQSSFIVAL